MAHRFEKISDDYGVSPKFLGWVGLIVAIVIASFLGGFIWFGCRVQPGKTELAVMMNKTGEDLSNEMVLAPGEDYKGMQLDVIVGPVRRFRNPYFYDWEILEAIEIPPMKVGVLVRKYGKPLPPGEIIARNPDEKGIIEGTITTGRHFINKYAYDVEIHDLVIVKPGFRALVTLLVGKTPKNPNVFVVQKGECGVQPYTLDAGTYPEFSNPYVYKIIEDIDARSQRFEMSKESVIEFPSKDGFDVGVEAITEWAINIDKLPETSVKYVEGKDLETSGGIIRNIQNKLILPLTRSNCRTIGSQHNMGEYITGDTRTLVQREVEKRLKEECMREGIEIKSFVIRAVNPSKQVREQYGRREIAWREMDRFNKEIETEIGTVVIEGGTPRLRADGQPELDDYGNPIIIGGNPKIGPDGKVMRIGGKLTKIIQERSKDRASQIGNARQTVVTDIRAAEQYMAVETTKAQRDLEVAKLNLQAAKDKAAQIFAVGKAEADVTVMKNKAEAEAVNAKVSAFGSGEGFATYQLITKIAPAIGSIWSNTEGPFAELFGRFASIETKQQQKKQ